MSLIIRAGEPKLLLPLGPSSRHFAAISSEEVVMQSVAADGASFEIFRAPVQPDASVGLAAVAAAHARGVLWVVSRDCERPCIGVFSAWEVLGDGALRRLRAIDAGGQEPLCIYTPSAPFAQQSPPHLVASASQLLLAAPSHGIMWTCGISRESGGASVRQTSRWCQWGPFHAPFLWATLAANRALAVVPSTAQPTLAQLNGDEEAQPRTCNLLLAPPDSHAASRVHGSTGGSDGVMLHNVLMSAPIVAATVLIDDGNSCTLLLLTPETLQLLLVNSSTDGRLQPRSSVPMSSPPLSHFEPSAVPLPPHVISSIPIGQGGVASGPTTRIIPISRLSDDNRTPSLVLIWQSFVVLIVDLERSLVTRCHGAIPAVPSFICSEITPTNGCERAFVVVGGTTGVNGCCYRGELRDKQWILSAVASSVASRSSEGGVYVGSPVVSVASHAPLATCPPFDAVRVLRRTRACVGTELSLLSCDIDSRRSSLLRVGIGVQATLFTPQPLSIGTPDNPVLGLHAVPAADFETDEFIIISYSHASAAISCDSSLQHLTSVTDAVCLQSNQPTLAAGRCGSLCLQVTPTSVVVLRSLQMLSQLPLPQVCWSAPLGQTIVLASFSKTFVALVVSHSGTSSISVLNFLEFDSTPRVTTFPCQQAAALCCTASLDASICFISVATYVQHKFHLWKIDHRLGVVESLLETNLSELLLHAQTDDAAEVGSIINSIWMSQQFNSSTSDSHHIEVYLGSRSGLMLRLRCICTDRSVRVIGSWQLSDSPLEFVFVRSHQGRCNQLVVLGDGQWLYQHQQDEALPQPVFAPYQTFEGACIACPFRSSTTLSGVIVLLRPMPKPISSVSGSTLGGAIIMDLPSVDCSAGLLCTATNLSLLNIDATCTHVAVLPRLSLTIVAALVHNRASLLFISQGLIIHSRPLIAVGGGSFVSLDAREDEGVEIGGFTIAVALAGGQDDAAFNLSRGDFTMFEGTFLGSDSEVLESRQKHPIQGGLASEFLGHGGALCILRARMKSQIDEEERFVGGNIKPTSSKFKVWITFEEPYYQRYSRNELVQGAGILRPTCSGVINGTNLSHPVAIVACISGMARTFLCGISGISQLEEIQVASNRLELFKTSRIQRIAMEGGEALAFMGTNCKTICLAVKETVAGGLAAVDKCFVSCGWVTSACGLFASRVGTELVIAESDASGERGWLMLRSGSAEKALHKVIDPLKLFSAALFKF